MAQAQLHINGMPWKVTIDPTAITGDEGIGNPRLLVPFVIDAQPSTQNEGREYSPLAIRAKLVTAEPKARLCISQAMSDFQSLRIWSAISATYTLEFPFTREALIGTQKVRVKDFAAVVVGQLVLTMRTNDAVSDVNTAHFEVPVTIPQSRWVETILPALGFRRYFLVEIPDVGSAIDGAHALVEDAEHAFGLWQRKAVFANCRDLGELLNAAIGRHFEKGHYSLEKWARAYKEFSHFTSIGLHEVEHRQEYRPGTVDITKADAEAVLLASKVLLKYASDLLSGV